MEYFCPTRARPVRDHDGLVWRSVARLIVSLFVKSKKHLGSIRTGDLIAHKGGVLQARVHIASSSDPFADGALCLSLLYDAQFRRLLEVEVRSDRITTQIIAYAGVAAMLLQLSQHPGLQRLILRVRLNAKRIHADVGVLTWTSLIFVVGELSRCYTRKQARQAAVAALCSVEIYVQTGEAVSCELFRRVYEILTSTMETTLIATHSLAVRTMTQQSATV